MSFSKNVEQFIHYLGGCRLVCGFGEVDFDSEREVSIALVHDGSGFSPGAAIVVCKGSHYEAVASAKMAFVEYLMRRHPAKVGEMYQQHGGRYIAELTKDFVDMSWGMSSKVAAHIIVNAPHAATYVSVSAR